MEKHRKFFLLIGIYMVHWSSLELAIDLASAKASGLTLKKIIDETCGKTVSDKIKKLRIWVEKSSLYNKSIVHEILDQILAKSVRNIIAHSYMEFSEDYVIFTHRAKSGNVTNIKFSFEQLTLHLAEVSNLATKLSSVFGETDQDAKHFIEQIRSET